MLKTTDFPFAFQTVGILQVWGVTPFPWSEVSHRPVPVTAATHRVPLLLLGVTLCCLRGVEGLHRKDGEGLFTGTGGMTPN